MGKKALTTDDWVKKATEVHGSRYDYSNVRYTKYACDVDIICGKHGGFTQRESNHRKGAGCPKCGVEARAGGRSHSFRSFAELATAKHGGVYTYPAQQIKSSRSKVDIVCPTHGMFTQIAYVHLAGCGCRACGYESNGTQSRIGTQEFIRRAAEVHGDTYEYVSGLSGMHTYLRLRCKTHGVFKQTPHNHLKGNGCPKCVNKVSKGEQALYEFVLSLGVKVKQSVRGVIGNRELDIYAPAKNVAIEYNGLWFHRQDLVGNKTREKWEACNAIGIKLIQVFEDEWLGKQDIVKQRIRAILGESSSVYARKCVVGRPDNKATRVFLGGLHTQGAGGTLKYSFGLYHEGVLTAVATFGKGRFGNTGWEMLRYASQGRVVGGISKLVSAFRKAGFMGQLVSYADLRWGDGEAYGAAGFTLAGITEPDYWWADCKNTRRISRYEVQPHKTGMPENKYADEQGLVKILGVGHKKWIKLDL